MSESAALPIDTGVMIALAAAMGDWEFLSILDRPIIVTQAVRNELRSGPVGSPGCETPMPPCMNVWTNKIVINKITTMCRYGSYKAS